MNGLCFTHPQRMPCLGFISLFWKKLVGGFMGGFRGVALVYQQKGEQASLSDASNPSCAACLNL